MIKEIRIYNFRSIQELILNPTQLHAILGPNSTGKSNVLKAIDLVLGESWTTKGKVSKELFFDPQKELKIEIYFQNPVLYDYYGNEKQIKCASVVMSCHDTSFSCESRLWLNSHGDGISGGKDKDGFYLNEAFKKACSFIYIPSQRDLSDQMRVSNWTMLGKMMLKIHENYADHYGKDIGGRKKGEQKMSEVFKTAISPAKDFLEEDFDASMLTFSKFKSKFIENCKKNSLGIANIFTPELDIYDVNWFYKTLQISISEEWNEKQFNALEVGSGMQNLLLLSIFQTYAELMGDAVIFGIEEPELFLYPHAQRGLYKTFRELSKTTQILYTTHNPAFLDASKPEEISMLRKTKNGTEQIIKDDIKMTISDEMRIYSHFNIERNEIFFANRIVLVEGPSEKMIFTNLCERKGIDIEGLGISVIECGGKTGVLYFIGVCRLSGLEYFAIWDSDNLKPDHTVDDKYKNIKTTLENGRGIELDDDIEDYIIKSGHTGYCRTSDKILNAYNWSMNVNISSIPTRFESIFDYIQTGKLIKYESQKRISIEDTPF